MDIETLALSKKYTSSSVTSALTGIASAVVDQDGTKIVVTTNDGQIFELNITNQLTSSETQLIQSLSIVNDKLCLDGEEVGNALSKDQLGILNSVANKVDQTYLNENFYNRINTDGKYATKLNLNSHTNDTTNPHKVELSQLADVIIDSPIDGQPLVYDSVTGKIINKSATTLSDGKVKIDSSSTANYLSQLIDNQTIHVDDGKLVTKTLDGLNVTITEINYLKGMDTNVKALISSIGTAGMYFGGVKQSKEDLSSLTGMSNGLTVIVQADESVSGSPTNTYIYDESNAQWLLVGATNIQIRDFTTSPIDLTKEVTGKLPKTNVDLTDLPTSSDLDNYLDKTTYDSNGNGIVDKAETLNNMTSTTQQIDASVKNSHSHTNNQAIEEATAGVGDGTKVWCDDNTFKTMQSGGSSNGSSVSKSDINGNIINNGEQMVVYDDSDIRYDIDSLNDRSTIGSKLNYLSGYIGERQISVSLNGRLNYNSIYLSYGDRISLNNGIITLKKGTYNIDATCRVIGDNNSAYIGYQLYNRTKGKYEGTTAQSIVFTFTQNVATNPYLKSIIEVTEDNTEYEIRINYVNGNISSIDSGISSLIIEETGRTLLLDPVEHAQDHEVKVATFYINGSKTVPSVTPLVFDRADGNIPLTNNGYIQLTANKTYLFSASIYNNSSTVVQTGIRLYDVTNNVALPVYLGINGQSGTQVKYTPTSDIVVSLCTGASYTFYNNYTQLTVHEIKNPVVVNYTTAQDISNPLMSSQISQEAPIGTVIEYSGTGTPEHYLKCNSIYAIADYQDFAQWIVEKRGKVNYWGGDGITSFGTPKYDVEYTVDYLVPTMTSDTAPSGQVFYSSTDNVNSVGWKAFDGITNFTTYWTGVSNEYQYLGYKFTEPKVVNSYTLATRSYNTNDILLAPRDWQIQGTNDPTLTTWTTLDTQTDIIFTEKAQTKTFIFENNQAFLAYRLYVTKNNGYTTSAYSTSVSVLSFDKATPKFTPCVKYEATHYAINQYGGFQMDTLWEGSASTINSVLTLEKSIYDYDYLIISRYFNGSSGTRNDVGDLILTKKKYGKIVYDPITLTINTGAVNGVSLSYLVEETKFTIKTNTAYSWQSLFIESIIGVKGSIPTVLEGGAL